MVFIKTQSDEARFARHVEVAPNGCHLWIAGKDKDGYGLFKHGSRTDGTRRTVRAHRWAYERFIGPIPDGMQLDHLCRTRACVNPSSEHMEVVTGLENTRRGSRANAVLCKTGHLLSGANLYVDPSTKKRSCKTCRRRWTSELGRRTNWRAQKDFRRRALQSA